MNHRKVIENLEKKYPGKKIIKNDEEGPSEIICEIEPTKNHPEYSIAVAVIDQSIPHSHKETKETYKVIKGKLMLYKNGEKFLLGEGDKLIVNPGEIHWAEGYETWVECYSEPGWSLEDYHLTEKAR